MSELVDCINNLSTKDIIRAIAKTANGTPFYLQTQGLAGFCDEYQRIYNDIEGSGTPPGDAIAAAQNTMVCGLIDDGVWAKFDIFYLLAQTTNAGGEALMNWVTTGLYNAVAVNAPAFVALEGFTGNASNNYLNTGWDPLNNGVNYVQDNASLGIYVRNNIAASNVVIGAWDAALNNATHITPRETNLAYIRLNTSVNSNNANTNSSGMYISARLNVNDQDLYRNKVKIINDTDVSQGLTNNDIFILALNSNGSPANFSGLQASCAFAASGFTQTDVDNMTDRLETYMDSNGKGVIP